MDKYIPVLTDPGNVHVYLSKIIGETVAKYHGKVSVVIYANEENDIVTNIKKQVNALFIKTPNLSDTKRIEYPNINEQSAVECALCIVIGNMYDIDNAKFSMACLNNLNKKIQINMVFIPTTFGTGSEITSLALVKNNFIMTPHRFRCIDENSTVNKTIIHDPLIVSKSYNEFPLFVDSFGSSVIELFFIHISDPNIQRNVISLWHGFKIANTGTTDSCLAESTFIPIVFRLSLLLGIINESYGYSFIHALSAPLYGRLIEYHKARFIISYVMFTKFNELLRYKKDNSEQAIIKNWLECVEYDRKLLNIDPSIVEILNEKQIADEVFAISPAYMKNSYYTFTNEQIVSIYTEVKKFIIESYKQKEENTTVESVTKKVSTRRKSKLGESKNVNS